MNGTPYRGDGGSSLRFERRLRHPPEKVWRALAEPAHLAAWFPATVEIDPRAGGGMRFSFPDSRGPTLDGAVLTFDPPRLLEYTWGDDRFRWELQSAHGGCLLVFTTTFDRHDEAAKFAAGWHLCLDALAESLDGSPVAGGMERWVELFDGYVARFTATDETAARVATPDG